MTKINIQNQKWLILTYVTIVDNISFVGGLRPYKLCDLLRQKGISASIVSRQKCDGDEIVIPEKKIPSVLKKILKIVPPDIFIFWTIRVAYKLSNNKDFVFFTTSPPHSIHMAALIFKLSNKKFFWVCDFRDPFLLNDLYKPVFFKHRFNKWYEKTIFKKADVILLNTDSNLNSYKKLYPLAGEKLLTVRNGFDEIVSNSSGDNFNFIYAGGTSKGLASKRIVEILQQLNMPDMRIVCDFYGEHDDIVDACEYTNYKGIINSDEVPALLSTYKFGFIFLPLPALGGGRIAQKYYDYIGSGVIPVVINPSKELEQLIQKFNTGVCIYPSSTIEEISMALKTATFKMADIDKIGFSRAQQFDKLFSYLNLS